MPKTMMLYYAKLAEKRLMTDIDRAWKRIAEYNIGDYIIVDLSNSQDKPITDCPYDIPSEIHKVSKMEEDLIKLQAEITRAYHDIQHLIHEKKRLMIMIARLEKISLKRDAIKQGFRGLDELRRDDLIINHADRILEIDEEILKHEFKKQIDV